MISVISDELREEMSMSRRTVLIIGVALIVVLGMGVLLLTWTTVTSANRDFDTDCAKLGGTAHELGSETLCIVNGRVLGRHG